MILKIRFEDQWWIYDNIEKARFNKKTYTFDEYQKLAYEDIPDIMLVSGNPTGNPVKVVEVYYRDIRDNEKYIVFNDLGFLCNDSGQTIEKLVP
jgi:hypothetical protein